MLNRLRRRKKVREPINLGHDGPYAPVNIFVGSYDIPRNGHIKISDAHVDLRLGYSTDMGWIEDPKGDPWLIVEDGYFWPVMVRLDSSHIRLGTLQTDDLGGDHDEGC